jgi:transcriptional regulator with XRE-family HTH domain
MEGDLQLTFGRNLRAHRKARDLSQEAFADVFGFNRTYMGAIERGERNLTLRTLERLAAVIKLDPLWLLTERGAPGHQPRPRKRSKRKKKQ